MDQLDEPIIDILYGDTIDSAGNGSAGAPNIGLTTTGNGGPSGALKIHLFSDSNILGLDPNC
jgi:hypothetical protein